MGPDRPITLHLADIRFDEVYTKAIVTKNLDRQLKVDVSVKMEVSTEISFHCALIDGDNGDVIREETFGLAAAKPLSVDWALDSSYVQLWWPNGSGEQKRYRFECKLVDHVGQDSYKRSRQNELIVDLIEPSHSGLIHKDNRFPERTLGTRTLTGSTREDILVRNQRAADLHWR